MAASTVRNATCSQGCIGQAPEVMALATLSAISSAEVVVRFATRLGARRQAARLLRCWRIVLARVGERLTQRFWNCGSGPVSPEHVVGDAFFHRCTERGDAERMQLMPPEQAPVSDTLRVGSAAGLDQPIPAASGSNNAGVVVPLWRQRSLTRPSRRKRRTKALTTLVIRHQAVALFRRLRRHESAMYRQMHSSRDITQLQSALTQARSNETHAITQRRAAEVEHDTLYRRHAALQEQFDRAFRQTVRLKRQIMRQVGPASAMRPRLGSGAGTSCAASDTGCRSLAQVAHVPAWASGVSQSFNLARGTSGTLSSHRGSECGGLSGCDDDDEETHQAAPGTDVPEDEQVEKEMHAPLLASVASPMSPAMSPAKPHAAVVAALGGCQLREEQEDWVDTDSLSPTAKRRRRSLLLAGGGGG